MSNLRTCLQMFCPGFPAGERDYGPYWRALTPEALDRITNGIGPARWPAEYRDGIAALIADIWCDELRDELVEDANVHDVGYELGRRNEEDRRFGQNMRKSVLRCTTFSMLMTRRGRARVAAALAVVLAMEALVTRFGGAAFMNTET